MSRKKSFTLMEVLIVIAILGIVMTTVSQIFIQGQKMWGQDLALVELQQKVRIASQRMRQDIREASSVSILDGGEKIKFSGIEYYLDNQNSQIKKANGSTSIIANNITDLNFSLNDGIVITVEAQKKGGQRVQVFSLKTKVNLRNE
ncbi:MAG: prepilin-type N-terminal cleavage/methylation domain-containing protein [Candidatus Omnitrophota bacterium]